MAREMTQVGDADAAAWPSRPRAWAFLFAVVIAALLSYTDRQVLSVLVDPIKHDLRLSDMGVSLLQSAAFALVYAFASLPLGRLADSRSRKIILVVGASVWSAATLLCALSTSFAAFFSARMAVGLGEAVLMPAAMSLIPDFFPSRSRGLATGCFMAAVLAGAGAAVMIGGWIFELAQHGRLAWAPGFNALQPWRQVLATLALFGVVLVLLLATIREPARRGVAEAADKGGWLELWGYRRTVMPLIVAACLCSVGDYTILSWAPALLSRKFGLSMSDIGVQLGTVSIVTAIAGPLAMGLLSDMVARSDVRRRILLCAACMTLAIAAPLLGVVGDSRLVVALTGLWIFLSVATVTGVTTSLQELVPNQLRGSAIAVVSFGSVVFGMGMGTTLAAFLTSNVFKTPTSIGLSVTLVAGAAAIIGAGLLLRAGANRAVGALAEG